MVIRNNNNNNQMSAAKFLSVRLAEVPSNYLSKHSPHYEDYTIEVDAFFRHVNNDKESFVRDAPALFEIDVGRTAYAWVFVFTDGRFERLFFGEPWQLGIPLPICDMKTILRDHPEKARTVIESMEFANVRDKTEMEIANQKKSGWLPHF